MSSSVTSKGVPSIRGAAINAIRAELNRHATKKSRELSADVVALMTEAVDQCTWQPLVRWQPLIRELASFLRRDATGGALRHSGTRIAESLFAGRYTFEEVRMTQWPAPVETLMVELARTVFNFGRWEFEVVRAGIEGIVHAYDAAPLSDDGRMLAESVIAALASRALGAEVRIVSARPEHGHLTFRIRRRGISLPPGNDQTSTSALGNSGSPAGE